MAAGVIWIAKTASKPEVSQLPAKESAPKKKAKIARKNVYAIETGLQFVALMERHMPIGVIWIARTAGKAEVSQLPAKESAPKSKVGVDFCLQNLPCRT